MRPVNKEILKVLILIVGIFSILAFIHFSGIHDQYLAPAKIRAFITSFGIFAPLVFMALYALPIFSDSIFAMVGGITFGPYWGTLYSVIGATLSSTFAFFIARYLGRRFVEHLLKDKVKELDHQIGEHGFKVILFMRLVPIFPYEGINYGSGLTRIKYRDFILATVIGILPGAFAYNYFGSSLIEATSSIIFVPISLVLLTLLFGPVIYKYYQQRNN